MPAGKAPRSFTTRNGARPADRGSPSAGSATRHSTSTKSAASALPAQRLRPVSTQSSPSRTARVETFARSEPASGSDSAMEPTQSPRALRRSSSALRASSSTCVPRPWPRARMLPALSHARASSSTDQAVLEDAEPHAALLGRQQDAEPAALGHAGQQLRRQLALLRGRARRRPGARGRGRSRAPPPAAPPARRSARGCAAPGAREACGSCAQVVHRRSMSAGRVCEVTVPPVGSARAEEDDGGRARPTRGAREHGADRRAAPGGRRRLRLRRPAGHQGAQARAAST